MRRLGDAMKPVTAQLGGHDEAAMFAKRASQVHVMFKDAIIHLYREHADQVLSHVNAVYVLDEDEVSTTGRRKKSNAMEKRDVPLRSDADSPRKVLVVYMDDSNFRSDIHSQQHFILLWFNEAYGVEIEGFKTFPSRLGMRQRHPFAPTTVDDLLESRRQRPCPLSEEELRNVDDVANSIESPTLRQSFAKAMATTLAWEKGKKKGCKRS